MVPARACLSGRSQVGVASKNQRAWRVITWDLSVLVAVSRRIRMQGGVAYSHTANTPNTELYFEMITYGVFYSPSRLALFKLNRR